MLTQIMQVVQIAGSQLLLVMLFTSVRGSVSWKASLQRVVALSTTKPEYLAAT